MRRYGALMDMESTYAEWLAEQVARELVARGVLPAESLEEVAGELKRMEREGWQFKPPSGEQAIACDPTTALTPR